MCLKFTKIVSREIRVSIKVKPTVTEKVDAVENCQAVLKGFNEAMCYFVCLWPYVQVLEMRTQLKGIYCRNLNVDTRHYRFEK